MMTSPIDSASQAGEQRYRHLFEHAPICIFVIDLSVSPATILEINRRAELVYGYPAAELVGKPAVHLVPEEAGPAILAIVQQVQQGQRVKAETTGRHRDGTRFSVRVIAAPDPTDASHMIVTVEDISAEEQRRSEEEAIARERLRIAHEIHDSVAQSLAGLRFKIKAEPIHNLAFPLDEIILRAFDAVIIINVDQQIIYFNRGAEHTFGYTAEEVLGQPLDVLLPDRFVELHRWHVKEFLASHDSARPMGEDIRVIVGLHQNGMEFPAEATIAKTTINETNQPFVSVFIRDITRRKQYEEKLSRITSHLNAAQRQAQFGSWEWYPDSNDVWWSDGFYAVLGLSPNRTSPGLDTLFGMTHPDDIDNLFQTFSKASADPEKYIEHPELFSDEFRMILPDGKVRWVYIKGAERAVDKKNRVIIRGFIQDITEHKKTLIQLKESEQRFRQLAENIQEVFWMYDPINETIAYISPAYEKIWGRSCESLYAAPRSFLEAIHPDDRPRAFGTLERQMDGKRTEAEYRVVQPDGKIRWVWDRGFPIFDDTGQVISVAGVAADITQRKETDAQIRYQANLVENVSDAIISTDNQFKIRSWNKAAEEIYGWQAEEMLGKRLSEVVKTTHLDGKAEDVLKQFLDQGHWQGEVIQTRKDGTSINIMASISSLKDQAGNVVGSVGINRDITKRKQAEQALQASETRYRDLVESIHDIIQSVDSNGKFQFVNRAWFDKLGYSPADLSELTLWDIIHPDYVAHCQSILTELKNGKKTRSDIKATFLAKDGHPVHVAGTTTARIIEDGEIVTHTFLRDITEQMRAEVRYQDLFDEAPVMYVITQAQKQEPIIVDCNHLFLSTLKYSRSEVIGRALGDFYTPASRAALLKEGYKTALQGDFSTAERQLVTRDGQVVDTLLRAKQEFNAKGVVIGTRAMYVDITERKQSEREREKLLNQVKAGREELRALTTRLVEIQENERHYLARELHDEVGQMLTGLTLILERSLSLEGDLLKTNLEQARAMVKELLERIRNLSLNLRPSMLDDFGLLAALLWHFDQYSAQTQIQVNFKQAGLEKRFRPEIEIAAYRIVQEALTNVARHADVGEVSVHLQSTEGKFTIKVEDRGRGFSLTEVQDRGISSGITGMRERASLLGGWVTVESRAGEGTRLTAVLPLTVTGTNNEEEAVKS